MFGLLQPPSSTPGGVSSTAAWQGLICAASCRSDTSLCSLAQLRSHSAVSPASRDALAEVKHRSPHMTAEMNACGEIHHPAPGSPNLAPWSKHWWLWCTTAQVLAPFQAAPACWSSMPPQPHPCCPFLQVVLSFQLSSQVVDLSSNELCSLGCPAPGRASWGGPKPGQH